MAPPELASWLPSLPPILHKPAQNSIQSCSKGSWGLSVFPRGDCIITTISTSLSLWRRQCGHRYAIRAGRNLPDKEFRYLRTVIVTAAVYWDFDQELAPHQLIFQHRAGVTPYTSTFVFAGCCVFNKQSQPPIFCNPFLLRCSLHILRAHLLPKLRCQFAEFLLQSSLKRLGILISRTCVGLRYGRYKLKLSGFSWDFIDSLHGKRVRFGALPRHTPGGFACQTPTEHKPQSSKRMSCKNPSPHRTCNRYGNINPSPISYASLPHLRGRLTLRR